nr:reverse transcriptase family protein [Rickettsia endosymbiont of Ceutorhynchus assimilis]
MLVREKLSLMGTGLGCCKAAEHIIELEPGTKPIKQRYYPVCPFKQKIIDDSLDEMLSLGVIEPSKSPWSTPICLARKKDNSYRVCLDFRMLNKVTKKDSYPIPYISSILDNLRNARYLSSIDIKSAFWQVPLSENSREFTAFTVPGRGLFQFCRMPFGLTNAPATWQRIVDNALGADLQPKVMVYLDDVILISETFEEHLRLLGVVLDRLREAGLVLSLDKCKFCMSQLLYLGYVVDRDGLRPDPEKVQAILNIPTPKNVNEIRRFIGTASWYRRFVPNFASILAPLTQLMKKNARWSWNSACENSFRLIKEHLVTAPVLTCPDFDRTFTLQTDASNYGIGAVLTQQFEEGEKVISYLSRSLTKQEQKYTVTEKECLAVIWSVEKLRHYLEHSHFKVITDHHSLLCLHRLKDPQGRLARWALRPYDFELIHRKGKDHVVPDFLSRSVPVVEVVDSVDYSDSFSHTVDKWYLQMFRNLENSPRKYSSWRTEGNILYKYVKSVNAREAENWKIVVP